MHFLPALSFWSWLTLLASVLLLIQLRSLSTSSSAGVFEELLRSQIQHGFHFRLDEIKAEAQRDILSQSLSPEHPHVKPLLKCPFQMNQRIHHIRLSYTQLNISFTPPLRPHNPNLKLFNPTLLPLPSWSAAARYLVVSRIVTEGLHQESVVCLADICVSQNSTNTMPQSVRTCTSDDLQFLGPSGGLRCTTEPIKLNIPPTPALFCEGAWSSFPNIPGFHDPRVFWSGKGEPLMILNSASQYGCLGLWVIDLRTIYPELEKLMDRHSKYSQPALSYHHLTELTRNPRATRASVEKNWIMWFPGDDGEAYIQYKLGPAPMPMAVHSQRHLNYTVLNSTSHNFEVPGRTFAKLLGNGFTTPDLTSPEEISCFDRTHDYDSLGNVGHWHQGSNSLRLILCTRHQARSGLCGDSARWNEDGREVHFAIVHRKFSNAMDLPMRYERYVAVWEGRKPFPMLGVSRSPILIQNEWARPWNEEENWPHGAGNWTRDQDRRHKRAIFTPSKSNAYFTYTPSLSWAWKPRADHILTDKKGQGQEERDIEQLSRLGTGFLGDDVLVGLGQDDMEQAFVKVKVDDLVSCLRLCPGVQEP